MTATPANKQPATPKRTTTRSSTAKPAAPKPPTTKELRDVTTALANQKRKEAAEAAKALEARQAQLKLDRENAEILARAVEAEDNAELAEREAEAARLHHIVNGTPLTTTPVVADVPAPAVAPTPTPAPVPPAQPTPPVQTAVSPTPPAPTVVVTPPTPSSQLGIPEPTEPPQRNRSKFVVTIRDHFATWSGLAWLLAILAGLTALFVMLATYDGFFPGKPDILRFIVAILIVLFCFTIGGLIGRAITNYNKKRSVEVTVTEEPPATPVA